MTSFTVQSLPFGKKIHESFICLHVVQTPIISEEMNAVLSLSSPVCTVFCVVYVLDNLVSAAMEELHNVIMKNLTMTESRIMCALICSISNYSKRLCSETIV